MIKVENVEVFNFEGALRGMRNPLNSWGKADSGWGCFVDEKDNVDKYDYPIGTITKCDECDWCEPLCENGYNLKCTYIIGQNDLDLMHRLYKAGTEHRKYARQIFVSMDITCNHIWWSELDTYKVGTTRNSCSKMHKIHVKEFIKDDFSHEGIDEVGGGVEKVFEAVIAQLEYLRIMFNETHEKKYWRAMIELLPMGYNIKATVTMNYENVFTMIKQRSGHKLDEWNTFVEILKDLPYVKEITDAD